MGAMEKFGYGLFILTAKEDGKDNGCVINTAMQVTIDPNQVVICVNKTNHTHDMIINTKKYNLSILTEETKFDIFKRFGYQSGRTADKFEGFDSVAESENGVKYLTDAGAMVSVEVKKTLDLGTHTMFIGEVTEQKVLSDVRSVTYQYYFDHIKPAPPKTEVKKGFRCKICGYIYEGDTLPPDFICPICKHGAEDFEPIV